MLTICLPDVFPYVYHGTVYSFYRNDPPRPPRAHPGSSCDDWGRPEFHAEPNRHRWSHGQESQGSPICWFSMAIPPTNKGDNYSYLVGGLGHVLSCFIFPYIGNNDPNWLYHQPLMKPLAISRMLLQGGVNGEPSHENFKAVHVVVNILLNYGLLRSSTSTKSVSYYLCLH